MSRSSRRGTSRLAGFAACALLAAGAPPLRAQQGSWLPSAGEEKAPAKPADAARPAGQAKPPKATTPAKAPETAPAKASGAPAAKGGKALEPKPAASPAAKGSRPLESKPAAAKPGQAVEAKPAAAPAPAAPPLILAPAAGAGTRPAPPGDDDFDLLAPAPAVDAAALARGRELEAKLATRRTLLGLHQLAGFVNLAGVTSAAVIGQLNYTDKYGGGGDTGKYHLAHQIAAYGSAGVFAATGLLALFAPSPIDHPLVLSNATVHKACMATATAGMVAQVVLGLLAANREGKISQRDLALAHQIVGYTTFAATAGGFVAITW